MDDSLYAVLKVQYIFNMAQWVSWLARQIVALEAKGSNPFIHLKITPAWL